MKLLFITLYNWITLIYLVCNTEYYKDGSDCVMYTGNTIKPMAGDVTSRTTSCDYKMKVANAEHTACGMLATTFMYSHVHAITCQLCFLDNLMIIGG